jgi:septum formation protein
MIHLSDKYKDTRLILASRSPRRQVLLSGLCIDFEVIDYSGVEETYPAWLKKTEIPVYLSEKKASALDNLLDDKTVIITADTIVWCRGTVMNKPADRKDATEMLRKLSGCVHQVISGVCVKSKSRSVSFYSLTSVRFRELTAGEINYYVENYQPMDKAGAYGIQEWIGYVGIESIRGSYFNVMGLPVDKLYKTLIDF